MKVLSLMNKSAPMELGGGNQNALRVKTTVTNTNLTSGNCPLLTPISTRQDLRRIQRPALFDQSPTEIVEQSTFIPDFLAQNSSLSSPAYSAGENSRAMETGSQPHEATASRSLQTPTSTANTDICNAQAEERTDLSGETTSLTATSTDSSNRMALIQGGSAGERLQRLVQRFGGVDGLEKHLESMHQSPSIDTSTPDQADHQRISPRATSSRHTTQSGDPITPRATSGTTSGWLFERDSAESASNFTQNSVTDANTEIHNHGQVTNNIMSRPFVHQNETESSQSLTGNTSHQEYQRFDHLMHAERSQTPSQSSFTAAIPSLVFTRIAPELPIPTLDQFLDEPNPWWPSLKHRLQRRLELLNSCMTVNPEEKPLITHQYVTLEEACDQMDFKYLVLCQTFAIISLEGSLGYLRDPWLMEGIHYFQEIFPPIREADRAWLVSFPCSILLDVENLQPWFERLSELIKQIGFQFTSLSDIHRRERRLPWVGEVEVIFPSSLMLQEKLVRALMARQWKPPHDDCFFRAFEAYKTARRQWQLCLDADPLIDMSRDVTGPLAMAYNWSHIDHIGHIAPSRNVVSNKASKKSETSNPGLPVQVPSPTQHSDTQKTSIHGFDLVSGSQNLHMSASEGQPASLQASLVASIPQQTSSQAVSPQRRVLQITNQSPEIIRLSDDEFTREITRHTSLTQHLNSSIFQYAPLREGTQYKLGFPLHNAHLRDPLNVINSDEPLPKLTLRSHIIGHIGKPWTFRSDTLNKRVDFEISAEELSSLAKEVNNSLGGPQIRIIQSGTYFLRLRGVQGRPKTWSDFVVAETHWPDSMAMLLNDQAVEFRRKPQYKTDLATDVSSRIRLGNNTLFISFIWLKPPPKDFNYTLALELARVDSIKDMKANVQLNDSTAVENMLLEHFRGTDDNSVQMIQDHIDITVTDPFTSLLPTTPVKSIHCTHFQCFDLDVYLESRPVDLNQGNQFLCPICKKDSRPGYLKIDGWMTQVIRDLRERNRTDAKMITVAQDLSWTIKEGSSIEDSQGQETGSQGGETTNTKAQSIGVIELD